MHQQQRDHLLSDALQRPCDPTGAELFQNLYVQGGGKKSHPDIIKRALLCQKTIPAHSGFPSDIMIKAKGALKALDLY